MATNVTIPPLGESITEATVGQWLKAPGDKVKADEPIVSLETDKVAVEVPSPVDGVMGAQLVQVGDTVTIGATIARIEEAAAAKSPAAPTAAPAPAAPAPAAAPEPPAPTLIKPAPPPPPAPVSLLKPAPDKAADKPAPPVPPLIKPAPPAAPPPPPVSLIKPREPDAAEAQTPIADVPAAAPEPAAPEPAPTATPMPPSVRRAAAEHDVDPMTLPGTGKDGRPTKADVLAAIEAGSAKLKAQTTGDNADKRAASVAAPEPAVTATPAAATPAAAAPSNEAAPAPVDASPPPATAVAAAPPSTAEVQTVVPVPAGPVPAVQPAPRALLDPARPEERVRMTRLRQTIARRLKEAQNTAAMLTTFNDVDMTAVMATRTRYKDLFEKKHGVRLGFMSFFVKAAVLALRDVPAVNAAIEGDEIVYHDYADIGVAVSSPGGLVVPVLKDADKRNFAEIELAIADFGKRAQAGKLALADLQGGTFTITNGGVFGSLMSTPILNPPQSGVLGMHRIEDRPVVVGGQIVIRPMMYLALSYDHRLVDGREAVSFLVRIKEAIEDPTRLLVDL